jgi:hypothetical protein
MAYLNSSIAAALLEAMVAFGSYDVGAVQRLPSIEPVTDAASLVGELTRIRMSEGASSEIDHVFISPWTRQPTSLDAIANTSREIDEIVSLAVSEEGPARPLSATYPTRWFEQDYRSSGTPTAHQILSYLLGAALGRWDIRIASKALNPPPMPGPYDPLPAASRGMLVGKDNLPVRQPSDNYPLNIPADRLLHDEPGHPNDVVGAIEGALKFLEMGSEPPELALDQEVQDLRRRLRGRFFADHVKDYSASRRHAPIYWRLTVPSGEWGLWVYAPALSREMLFAIAGSARDKFRRLREQAQQLRDRHFDTSARAVVGRVEQVESLAGEIEQFAEHAEKVAQSGWRPDLNDGLILCAAPLEPLFADDSWRKRVAQYRKDLENKKYPWATVQREFFGGGS